MGVDRGPPQDFEPVDVDAGREHAGGDEPCRSARGEEQVGRDEAEGDEDARAPGVAGPDADRDQAAEDETRRVGGENDRPGDCAAQLLLGDRRSQNHDGSSEVGVDDSELADDRPHPAQGGELCPAGTQFGQEAGRRRRRRERRCCRARAGEYQEHGGKEVGGGVGGWGPARCDGRDEY